MDEEVRGKLRLAGRAASEARELGLSLCKEGALVLDIAERIEAHMRSRGAPPAFPTCLSIDHLAAHYSPVHNDRLALKRGNVVKLDLGAQVDGYIADTAATVEVGTRSWTELIKASEVACETAIEVCRPKTPTRLIGAAIERAIEGYGFKPISNLTGHTIERYHLHAGKSVPNVGGLGGDVVEAGDTLAIEPFATNGAGKVEGRKSGRRTPASCPGQPRHRTRVPERVPADARRPVQDLAVRGAVGVRNRPEGPRPPGPPPEVGADHDV